MAEARLAARRRTELHWINGALLLAVVLLAVGVFAPLLTLKRLFVFTDTISLASALATLAAEGHFALFLLLFGFSIVFPVAKLAYLLYLWNRKGYDLGRRHRLLQWLGRAGRWSMLDVFVVALLVVSVKLQWIADVEVRFGLYAFGASVLLTMLVHGRLTRLAATFHPA